MINTDVCPLHLQFSVARSVGSVGVGLVEQVLISKPYLKGELVAIGAEKNHQQVNLVRSVCFLHWCKDY